MPRDPQKAQEDAWLEVSARTPAPAEEMQVYMMEEQGLTPSLLKGQEEAENQILL